MNKIKATASGVVPVVVINPNLVFACAHIANPFSGAITLTLNGIPYPELAQWHRFTRKDGTIAEDSQQNFSVRDVVSAISGDGVFYETYRSMPVEAIEPIAIAKLGDQLVVESRRLGRAVTAKVLSVEKRTGFIGTDFIAESGDSGSVVTDSHGVFVGFVSAKSDFGSLVVIPDFGVDLSGTTPVAPNPNQPQVGTPEPTLEAEYARGFGDGKKSAENDIKKKLEGLFL